MKTVWKFPIQVEDTFDMHMPRGAQVLSVQVQAGSPVMWALVDPDAKVEERWFRVAGTGHAVDDEKFPVFIGTFQLEAFGLVFHVFAQKNYGP